MSDDLAERREAEYGYRTVGGKAFRLQQWAEKRERREFDALVNRLRAAKWQREVYDAEGDRLARLRARKLAWFHGTRDRRTARRRGRGGVAVPGETLGAFGDRRRDRGGDRRGLRARGGDAVGLAGAVIEAARGREGEG